MVPLSFPLRRSPVFWGGLLIGAFLVFGWVDSRWNGTYVVLEDGTSFGCPGLMRSRLSVLSFDRSVPVPDLKRGGRLKVIGGRDALEPGSTADDYFSFEERTSEPVEEISGTRLNIPAIESVHVAVPYWELILTYLCCWVAVLWWRERRWRKMVGAMALAAADR